MWNFDFDNRGRVATRSDSGRPGWRNALPDWYIGGMKLFINGEERQLEVTTVSTLVEQLGMKADRVAVELNREIVSRADWSKTALRDGDKLEIVHFVGGGLQHRGALDCL